jgi:hypothetical protein
MSDLTIEAQMNTSRSEDQRMGRMGDQPDSYVELTISRGVMAETGLIDSDGRPAIKAGDRLLKVMSMAGSVFQTFDRPPGGLPCTKVRNADAFLGNQANFIIAVFEDRPQDTAI